MGWVRDILNTFVITDGDFADYDGIEDFFNTVMAGVCVMCAGLAAGLTMGLLSLDVTKLEIKCRVGTDEEKSDAAMVLPIVKQHHLLLVTLLLFNSIANETLPIFLGELVPNYLAILLAVFLILIFGEILPSAFFTGVHQLRTSARLVPVVYCLIAVLYPVAYPISKALDKIFGEDEEEGAMTRSELEALVLMQQAHTFRLNTERPVPAESSVKKKPTGPSLVRENSILPPLDTTYGSLNETTILLNDLEAGDGAEEAPEETLNSTHRDGLSAGEVTLMLGVLNLAKQTVGCAMIALEKVFMVSSANRLDDRAFLQGVLRSGFSRIPVFYRDNNHHILGYMLVKELILVRFTVLYHH
jgi:CBS domain containing-hemolysin-like protein